MKYRLVDIVGAQETLKNITKHNVNQHVNFLIQQANHFGFEKKGYFKRYQRQQIPIDQLTEIVQEFADYLEQLRHQHHQHLTLNNDDFVDYAYRWDTEEHYLEHRSIYYSAQLISFVGSLLGRYVDWKYPVVYLEPNSGDLMRVIGAGDPFYIVDDRRLPYQEILKKFPAESTRRFLYYKKSTATRRLEKHSAQLTVSWKNFPFSKLTNIKQDLKLMTTLTAPGGIIMFDYVDGASTDGAKAVESKQCGYQSKSQIHEYLHSLDLEIIEEINEHGGYPFNIVFCRKPGAALRVNLNNKIGLVKLNPEQAELQRKNFTELKKHYKSINGNLHRDTERFKKRDLELVKLDQQRRSDPSQIVQQKLKVALKNLDIQRSMYHSDAHPAVLEALLHASKLTFRLGRHKDSYNLIKRISKKIDSLDASSRIAKQYHVWLNFLNKFDL